VIADDRLTDIARQLSRVDGVVGVVLGGSRARGTHTAESDVDLGLYYRPPLDVAALGALAREFAGPLATVTNPGEWGPWVDGGGWLRIDGTPVDWIYRDLDRVKAAWSAAAAGRVEFHFQTGHPFGVPEFAYAGEVALGKILDDQTAELTALQAQVRHYPAALGKELVRGLWEASFNVDLARKASGRQDTAYIAGCLFRVVLSCAHALHGHAGRWLVNEKGAIRAAGLLPGAPADFEERAQRVLAGLGTSTATLETAIESAVRLLAEVSAACGADEGPRRPAE
jgi:predicted nucleotidyltransferase